MKNQLLLLLSFLCLGLVSGQDDGRQLLRGKVLYRNSNVPNENVINTTSDRATITNENGQFAIRVKEGDELAFMAINYQLQIVKITPEILKNNRLVVEVNEKVTELDEVVVSPENQKKFLEVQNEDFKQYEYETDRSTEVINVAESQTTRGMRDGINFVNIFRALVRSNKDKTEARAPLKVSEVLRQVYDDEFFVVDLRIPQDKIDNFLYYCDAQMPAQSLLKRDNEFQLIDFLVSHSKKYLKELNEEK
ncbi:carboxypeptidase-like regulatory domain-containing protein [Flavobacteriaceae bacterium 3-367]